VKPTLYEVFVVVTLLAVLFTDLPAFLDLLSRRDRHL